MKSTIKNNANYMHQYEITFKERLKQQIKENYRNFCNLPSVSTAVVILIVLIKMIMMVLRPSTLKKMKTCIERKFMMTHLATQTQ